MGRLIVGDWYDEGYDYLIGEATAQMVESQEFYWQKEEKMTYTLGIKFPKARTFEGKNTTYHYRSTTEVPVGGHVIVDSPYDGLTCVKVVSCVPWKEGSKAAKWIVDVVDKTAYTWQKNVLKEIEEIEKKLEKLGAFYVKKNNWTILRSHCAEARMLWARQQELKEQTNG